jgi:hypothetical protein
METEPKKLSKSVRILDLIAAQDGMSFTAIQRHLFNMSKPIDGRDYSNLDRGYWCTNLSKGSHGGGLLDTFCIKGPDKMWRRNSLPHNGHPWSLIKRNRC